MDLLCQCGIKRLESWSRRCGSRLVGFDPFKSEFDSWVCVFITNLSVKWNLWKPNKGGGKKKVHPPRLWKIKGGCHKLSQKTIGFPEYVPFFPFFQGCIAPYLLSFASTFFVPHFEGGHRRSHPPLFAASCGCSSDV